MDFGKKLKDMRTYELITQEQIAKELGIKRSTYKGYENHNRIIPVNRLNDFCNLFNISLDHFFEISKQPTYNLTNKTINNQKYHSRIKSVRIENNLTQAQMAKILGIGKSTISQYENGDIPISTFILYKICKNFHVSADYLLGKIDSDPIKTTTEDIIKNILTVFDQE